MQINAVRLLIAEHQLAQIRTTVGSSAEPVVIGDARGRALFANAAFAALTGWPETQPLGELASLFSKPVLLRKVLSALGQERQPWRGEMALTLNGGGTLPVSVRAEIVPARDGSVLGFFLLIADLTDSQRATQARKQLEHSLLQAGGQSTLSASNEAGADLREDVMGAILANASLAAMDIADGSSAPTVAPLLEELEVSTRRAAELYGRIRLFES